MRGKGGMADGKKATLQIHSKCPEAVHFFMGIYCCPSIKWENPSAKSSSGKERDCRSARPLLVFMDEQFKAPPEGPMTTEDQ